MSSADLPTGRKSPGLAALLVNWERPGLTIAALNSLLESAVQPREVVVVDNASRDDSIERLRDWAVEQGITATVRDTSTLPDADAPAADSWLTVIAAPANAGFAAGNNLGLRYLMARPETTHVFLLNNDARVDSGCIAELDRALGANAGAGIVTGTIFVDSPAEDVWYAGGREIPLRGLTQHLTVVPTGDAITPTEFVSGCAMIISREAIEKVGLLAECYDPGYWEDAEYSRRVRRAGFPVLYVPSMKIYHQVGGTTGAARASPAVTYVQSRNRLFYIRRNYTGITRALAVLYNAVTKPGRALVETAMGRPRIGWAVLRGTVHGMIQRCDT